MQSVSHRFADSNANHCQLSQDHCQRLAGFDKEKAQPSGRAPEYSDGSFEALMAWHRQQRSFRSPNHSSVVQFWPTWLDSFSSRSGRESAPHEPQWGR